MDLLRVVRHLPRSAPDSRRSTSAAAGPAPYPYANECTSTRALGRMGPLAMRLCTALGCAALIGLASRSTVAAEAPSQPARPPLEASVRSGLRLPRCIEGSPGLPAGFGVAIGGDVRMASYFAGGALVEQVRFSSAEWDGGFVGYTLAGLLLRGYFLSEGVADPYLELVLGGTNPIGIEHEGGLAYRAAVGIDLLVLPWLEVGLAGSYAALDYYFRSTAQPVPLATSGSGSNKNDPLTGAWGVDAVVTLLGP